MFRRGLSLALATVVLVVGGMALVTPARSASPAEQSAPSPAMLLETEASAALLVRGRAEVLSGSFEVGEETFYELAGRADGRPAAYHHLASTSLLRVLMFDREEDYDQFFQRSDSLRKLLKDERKSPGRAFLEGETDFQRALAWSKQGHYVRAAMAGVSSYRALSNLLDDEPEFWEAYKSLGIVHATLGTLPRRYRRFLSVFGFDTDLEAGLDELEVAINYSAYGREESLLFLSILDSFELPSRVDAAQTLTGLRQEFSGSPLFGAVLLDALLRSRRVSEAEALLVELRNPAPGVVRLEYLEYFQAESHFKQERWTKASQTYAQYLASHKGNAYRAVSTLNLGLSLEMSGDRLEAERVYASVIAGRDMDADEASERQARLLLEAPMSPERRQLLEARMAHDRSDYVRADSLLTVLASQTAERGRAFLAEVAYRHGRVFDVTERDRQALTQYQLAIDRPGDPSAKWGPYSLFYRGRIQDEAGLRVEARKSYRAVLDYKPSYDYSGTNEQRARFALERLDD
ncbi:MAG: tetratricopeptide (TPR) repeat protein [Rhodothermales bacterium]